MKKETFEGQECPTWKEMNKMIFDLVIKQKDYNHNEAMPKYHKMIAFMQTVRPLFDVEESICRIYGSQISFELFVPEKDLKEKVLDISSYPENYYSCGGRPYYEFLKFVWIDLPNGRTVRIQDYANENGII